MYNESYEEVTISVGPVDTNENTTDPCKSATRSSKLYQFCIGSTIIRLIDTPGIGDTAGYDQDRKNLQNILGTLSYHEELHGICILLKPNNARLAVIKELLTNLHKDASRNILFCFTNSRSTFYKPGETLSALQKVLAKNEQVEIPLTANTIYCFDSEAYRFMAANKNNPPVLFCEDDVENFSQSWNKSFHETARMLEHICKLEPHKIKSTVNLHFARESILQLTRPIAEINGIIGANKAIIEEELEELKQNEQKMKDLKKKKIINGKEDPEIVALLNKGLTAGETKTRMINIKRVNIAEYERDLDTIKNASAKFAFFLKHNSMTPYNDGLEAYLKLLIRNEEEKVNLGGSIKRLKILKDALEQYIEEKDLLERSFKTCESGLSGATALGPEEVQSLIQELKDLPRVGPQIKQAMECLKQTTNVVYNEIPVYQTNPSFFRDLKNKVWERLVNSLGE